MNYRIQIVGQREALEVTQEQADQIRSKMADANAIIVLGTVTLRSNQIKGIYPIGDMKQTKHGVRQELQEAARRCDKCKTVVGGKEVNVGFVDVFIGRYGSVVSKWEPFCEVQKVQCMCQRTVKGINGIEPDDYDKLYSEFSIGQESNYAKKYE